MNTFWAALRVNLKIGVVSRTVKLEVGRTPLSKLRIPLTRRLTPSGSGSARPTPVDFPQISLCSSPPNLTPIPLQNVHWKIADAPIQSTPPLRRDADETTPKPTTTQDGQKRRTLSVGWADKTGEQENGGQIRLNWNHLCENKRQYTAASEFPRQ